jgi:hypothetical protein
VTGTITAADIKHPRRTPFKQGIAPGEFDEALQAIRDGMTHTNVHTDLFPGVGIRGQIKGSSR